MIIKVLQTRGFATYVDFPWENSSASGLDKDLPSPTFRFAVATFVGEEHIVLKKLSEWCKAKAHEYDFSDLFIDVIRDEQEPETGDEKVKVAFDKEQNAAGAEFIEDMDAILHLHETDRLDTCDAMDTIRRSKNAYEKKMFHIENRRKVAL